MISGRGFVGIAAQSLGMGRPVLPPQLAAMLLCHHQIVGLMLAGMRKKHAKYTPLRFHGCGPLFLKAKGPRRHCLRGFVLL